MFIQKITLKMNINNITDYEIKLHDVNDNEKIMVYVNEKKVCLLYKNFLFYFFIYKKMNCKRGLKRTCNNIG